MNKTLLYIVASCLVTFGLSSTVFFPAVKDIYNSIISSGDEPKDDVKNAVNTENIPIPSSEDNVNKMKDDPTMGLSSENVISEVDVTSKVETYNPATDTIKSNFLHDEVPHYRK